MQVPLLHHRVPFHCVYHICNVQYTLPRNVLCAGTTALLSALLFSCKVSVVKSALLVACQDTWRQYSYGVYRVCCMLSVV